MAAPIEIKAKVTGIEAAVAKMEQVARDMTGPPIFNAIRDATLLVTARAKGKAPVDTGRLRSSIAPEVRVVHGLEVQGIVGSNVVYAPYMELGTGTFVGRPAHHPPASKLEVWARRHGLSAYVVARAIGLRGGLEGRRFLHGALEENEGRIKMMIEIAVARTVNM